MMPRRAVLWLMILWLLASPVAQAAAPPLPDLGSIEAALNAITTLKARFVQTVDHGRQAGGTFLLKRPGRLRFEYDPPLRDFIVADGLLVYYYDAQLKQQSNVPISRSLADFFLRPELRLSGDITVQDLRRADGLLQLTLTQTKDPLAGTLTLMFSEGPLRLQQWRVVDAQGAVTTVELFDIQEGIKLSNHLFHYYDPEQRQPAYGRN